MSATRRVGDNQSSVPSYRRALRRTIPLRGAIMTEEQRREFARLHAKIRQVRHLCREAKDGSIRLPELLELVAAAVREPNLSERK